MDPNKIHALPDSPNHQIHRFPPQISSGNLQYTEGYPPSQIHINSPQSPYGQALPPPHFFQNFHPFAAPSQNQPYAHPAASFQGLLSQASPLLQPLSLFGGVCRTSSQGVESGTSRSRRQEKQQVDVEEVNISSGEEEQEKKGRANWTEEENLRLASAWLKHSVDSVDGNAKKSEYYWKQVADEFNDNRPANGIRRSVKQLSTHWSIINKSIGIFFGVHTRARNTYVSGQSDDMLMNTTREWYKEENKKKPFTMEYLWDILKDQPKWKRIYAPEHSKRTKISESGAYTSSSNQESGDVEIIKERRPGGQKSAKERRKGKGKYAPQSSCQEDKPSEDMLLFHDAIGKRLAALVQTAEASKERTSMTKLQIYLDLLAKDTSTYNEAKLARHEQALEVLGKQLNM